MWFTLAASVPLALFGTSLVWLALCDVFEFDRHDERGWRIFNNLALTPTVVGLALAAGAVWWWSALRYMLAYEDNVRLWYLRKDRAKGDFFELLEWFTDTLPNSFRKRP